MSYYSWEKKPSFCAKNGREVWPVYAPGVNGTKNLGSGGTIYVHDEDVELEDIEYPPGWRHRVGSLSWYGPPENCAIENVEVKDHWQRQGVATQMLRLAREIAPGLKHSPTHRSAAGEAFVRATDPQEALPCPELEGLPAEVPAEVPAENDWWTRLVRRVRGR